MQERAFEQIAAALRGYTKKCVISFVDTYAKNRKRLQELGIQKVEEAERKSFAKKLCAIAHANDMEIAACAETMDFTDCGILPIETNRLRPIRKPMSIKEPLQTF